MASLNYSEIDSLLGKRSTSLRLDANTSGPADYFFVLSQISSLFFDLFPFQPLVNMLCAACQSIFETCERQGSHHETVYDFQHAIESNCPLCFIVLRDARETAKLDLLSCQQDQTPFSYFQIDARAPAHRLVIYINDMRDTRIKQVSSQGRFQSVFCIIDLERTDLNDVFSARHTDMDIELVMKAVHKMSNDDNEQLPSNTSHPSVANRALEWLDKCLKTHKVCERDRNIDWYPPRLLDLTSGEPRLILREEEPQGSYAALSHCWGRNPSFLTLTAANLEDMRKNIPLSGLPKNFHDAIQIARQLGIKYLWIDSLCILQSGPGSNQDWLEQRNCHEGGLRELRSQHRS